MRVVITTIAILVCIGSLKAQTETVNLLAISDNTIFESNPLFNSNGSGALMYVGNDLSGYATRALMKFDVAGSLPAGVTVVSARLRLTMDWSYNLYSTGQETLELHRLLNDWGEGDSNNGLQSNQPGGEEGAIAQSGDATWLIRMYSNPFNSPGPPFWTNPGGDFATAVSTGASVIPWPDLYNWDSTPQLVADVQDMLDNPSGNYGWLLKHANEGGSSDGNVLRFSSREGLNPPILEVTYELPPVPTMSQWSLLLFGLLLLSVGLATVYNLRKAAATI